jgi:hypothetical protein
MLILFAPGIPRERFVTERRNLRIGFDPCRTGVASSTPGMTSTWSELQVRVGYQPVPARAHHSRPTLELDARRRVVAAWILDARSTGPVTCGHERLRKQSTQLRGQRGWSHASEVHVPWNRTRLGVAFGTARDVGKRRAPIAGANRHNAAAASTCQTA